MTGRGISTHLARKHTLGLLSLLGLSASLALSQFIQSASPSYAQSTRSLSKSQVKLSGRVNFNKYSGAESGVQLLDNIFNRVSNIPQVASIQNQVFTQTQQRLANKDNIGKDSIDYKLAIRPKETGKPFANITPSLQISDKSPLLAYDQNTQSSRIQSQLGAAANGQAAQAPGAGDDFDSVGERSVKNTRKAAEVWKGNSKYVHQAAAQDEGSAEELRSGVWDREGTASQIANEVNAYNSLAIKQAARGRMMAQRQTLTQTGLHSADSSYLAGTARRSSPSSSYGASAEGYGGGYGGSTNAPPSAMGKVVRQGSERNARAGSIPAPQGFGGGSPANRLKQQGVNVYTTAAEAQSRMPELANSLNKFYNINKGFEDVQQFTDRLAQAPAAPAPMPMGVTNTSLKKKTSYNSPRDMQIVDERPSVRDFRESAKLQQLASADAPNQAPAYAAAPSAAKPTPMPVLAGATRRLDSNESKKREVSGEKAKVKEEIAQKESSLMKESEKDSISEKKRDLLALLPPNVATGIPLVSLGTSQSQAMNALSAIGQLKEQKIGKWTVLTWKKKDSSFIALQLFFRHGLLDAMRIFDQSLIAPDFGAAPGANLEAVKARFGEPAFLLPEPNPGIGQNYVYPISQVGFQFARPEKDTAPQVVSVLIFSVK